jgi:Leucine-rich repeat (LRR) protein
MGELPKLEQLSLSNNKLTFIPNSFCKMPNIKFLFINNNKLKKLPDNLLNFKNLVILELKNNNFSDDEKTRLKNALTGVEIIF